MPTADGSSGAGDRYSAAREPAERRAVLDLANVLAGPLRELHDGVAPLLRAAGTAARPARSGPRPSRPGPTRSGWIADQVATAHRRRRPARRAGRHPGPAQRRHRPGVRRTDRPRLPVEIVGLGGLLHLPEIADVIAVLRCSTTSPPTRAGPAAVRPALADRPPRSRPARPPGRDLVAVSRGHGAPPLEIGPRGHRPGRAGLARPSARRSRAISTPPKHARARSRRSTGSSWPAPPPRRAAVGPAVSGARGDRSRRRDRGRAARTGRSTPRIPGHVHRRRGLLHRPGRASPRSRGFLAWLRASGGARARAGLGGARARRTP